MAVLEKQVRKALIEQRAEESYQFALNNPEYQVMVLELSKILASSMINVIKTSEDLSDEEKNKMMEEKEEIIERCEDEIEEQFENPEQLKKMMYEQAKRQLISYKQLRAELKLPTDIKGEIGEKVSKEYERTYQGLFESARTNDKIVRKLAKIAETEGIEKAIKKETRYAIIRELFLTAEECRAFTKRKTEALKKFYQQAQSTLTMDGKAGQMLARLFGVIEKVKEEEIRIMGKLQEDYTEKMIKEIYG